MRIFIHKATKFLIALCLLPILRPLIELSWYRASSLSERTLFGLNPLSLALLGMILWIMFSIFFHLPSAIYVFAHELSHALFVKLFGGKIKKINIRKDRGYVVADRTNFLITLAPYIYPFYAFGWALLGIPVLLFWPGEIQGILFWTGLGVGLGYHWMMTARMMTTRQTDFSTQGYFFSFVLILEANLLWFYTLFALLPNANRVVYHFQRLGLQIVTTYTALWDWIIHGNR